MKIIQIERGVMANAYEVRRLLKTKDGEGREFCGVDLHDADLAGAELSGIKLTDADLHGACLRGACLRGADLTRANLCGADLRGADLSCSLLADADLFCADLRGADLSSAVLRGALLRMTDLEGITVDDCTVITEEEEDDGYFYKDTNYYREGESSFEVVLNDDENEAQYNEYLERRLEGADHQVRYYEDEDGNPCEEETWYKDGELIRSLIKYF